MSKTKNKYDDKDMVRQDRVMRAGPLKIAEYRVRDPETLKWGKPQFHMTYNNTVLAVMGEEAARLFASFVNEFAETGK